MRATLLPLSWRPLLACAQSWCTPGATWTYGTEFISLYGYAQYTYVSDTTLGGQLGHRIDANGAMSYFGQTGVNYWSQPIAAITAQIGDVVSLWSDTEQTWDTLFWLGAVPGDSWIRRGGPYGDCDPPDSLVIVDTTTVVFDGLPLRRWTVDQRTDGVSMFTETFTERLGWTMNFSPYPACIIVDGPVGMRCYSDQDITVSFTGLGCETLVGINDREATARLSVFPNPGTDHFNVALPPGAHVIRLCDAIGRELLNLRALGPNVRVDTAIFLAGIYFIGVDDQRPERWVKE